MPQAQEQIPLILADGQERAAVRTGNNAAWMCPCGRALPLVGFSDVLESTSGTTAVDCPSCGRRFRVISSKVRGSAEQVREVAGTA